MNLELVRQKLEDRPTAFGFFQAVRLLEAMLPERSPIGGFESPLDEAVTFSSNPSIAFPPSEIETLEIADEGPSRMSVNFMGLVGPQGALPLDYTILVAERRSARDTTLRDFLDIFQSRMVALFYRAWLKHRFLEQQEREGQNRLGQYLLDLSGLGLPSQKSLPDISVEVLAGYAGLLSPQQRSAQALQQLLEDYFQVPASIEEFVGDWYPLRAQDQCEVGDEGGLSSRLGMGALAGDEVWDPQARARVRLGPLTRGQYEDFLPNGNAHEELRTLLRFFSHDQFEFEVQLVLDAEEVPELHLGGDEDRPLGWATWLRTKPPEEPPDQTVFRIDEGNR
ncbi:MAG: type VI secretion system baseplate subunit TssG [Longimicrobiales bacterium]